MKQSAACCFSCPAHGDPIPDPRDSPSDPETSRTVWSLHQGNRGGGTLPPLPLHCLTCAQHCCWSIEIIPDKLPGLKIGRPEINGSFLCGKICPKLLQHCSPPQQAMLAKKQSVVKFKKLPLSALLSKRIDHQASFPAKLYYTSFWIHIFWDASQIIENSLGWWVPVMSRRIDQEAPFPSIDCSSSRPWTTCSTICDRWLRSSPICLLQDPGCCLLETRFITSRWGSESGDP